jgi:hypothetical protein
MSSRHRSIAWREGARSHTSVYVDRHMRRSEHQHHMLREHRAHRGAPEADVASYPAPGRITRTAGIVQRRAQADPAPAPAGDGADAATSDPVLVAHATPRATVRQGSTGGDVTHLQELLNQTGAALTADGKFGPRTRAAVVAFQQARQLTPDGIVGPMTWGALQGGTPAAAPPTPGSPPPGQTPPTQTPPTSAPPGQTVEGAPPTTTIDDDTPAPGEPPEVAEPAFETRGRQAIDKIKAAGHASSGSLMRGEGSGIQGFPAWFVELQDMLSLSAEWKAEEEEGQKVLHDYATWYAERKFGGKMPGSLEVFFRYIGRSQRNVADAKKEGFESTAGLGGQDAKTKNWCQAASSSAAVQALAERGLKFKNGAHAWLNNAYKRKGGGGGLYGANAYGAELHPGDYVSYFYQGCQHGGHAVTAVEDLGDSFLHVSGNTGGVGAVRLQESKRMKKPPPGFKQGQAELSSEHCRSINFGDQVLVWSITRAGDIWSELAELDNVDPAADPAGYDAVLNRLELARIGGT